MLFDFLVHHINLRLDFYSFGEGRDDAAVMLDVLRTEEAFLAVFEPFVEDLIAADLIFPNLWFHALKILSLVDIGPLLFMIVCLFFYPIVSFSLEAADGLIQFRRLEQVQLYELLSSPVATQNRPVMAT